ncbi:MAG: signal peptidase I [Lachnospiraceae bacterium]|nr:signal peptidase I [Lachnospiraceae bacterium]
MRGKKVSGFRRRIQAKRRSLNFNKHRKQADFKWIPKLLISLLEVAIIIGAAYACVFFFGKAVYAIGDSMAPNIVEDDALLLNRFDYVFRSPKRGDVVAFKVGGREEASVSVKRIIGLPGETVWINGGKVFINGEIFDESETIPVISDAGLAVNEVVLKDNEYFVLGDNRNHSTDSRFASVGNVDGEYFLGRVWFNLKKGRFGLVE